MSSPATVEVAELVETVMLTAASICARTRAHSNAVSNVLEDSMTLVVVPSWRQASSDQPAYSSRHHGLAACPTYANLQIGVLEVVGERSWSLL
jgi:hypothetical protein